MDLKFILDDKLFFFSVFLVIISIIWFCISLPNREMVVLSAFLFFLIISMIKYIK